MNSNTRDVNALLERARKGYIDWNWNEDDPKKLAEHFQKLVGIVKAVYNNRLPFDPDRAYDPGALYEYDDYLPRCDPEAAKILKETIRSKVLGQDDPRALRAVEVLREAFYHANKPQSGFQAIGRPPELQQLVAATCLDIFTTYACGANGSDVTSQAAQLLRQLCPQLQVNVLADVATGILCAE
jgi:hypothetical protein